MTRNDDLAEPAYTAKPDEPPKPAPPVLPRDVWDVVDELTQPKRQRFQRDAGVEWFEVPSLLTQLYEAIESGAGNDARGKLASKPPLDSSALSLWLDIAAKIRNGLKEWGIKPQFDESKDLRSFLSGVVRSNDYKTLLATFALVKKWRDEIKTVISNDPDRSWRMHGARCRVCSSTTMPSYNTDGELTRIPALLVHSTDGRIDRIECGFCGSVLSGPDMVAIVNDTLKQQDVAETA